MVNAYADFKTKKQKGQWYQGLYRLPNNLLNVYTRSQNNGHIDLSDGQVHQIRVELWDPMGNHYSLHFKAQYTGTKSNSSDCSNGVTAWNCLEAQTINSTTLRFSTSASSLYDDLCFRYTETPSDQHLSNIVQLHDASVPLQDYCPLAIRLNQPIPFALRSKLILVHEIKAASLPGNHPQNAVVARYDQGWASAEVRTLGTYYAQIDTIPPQIVNLQKGNNYAQLKQIRFKVNEDHTQIKSFEARLNGHWLRFVRSGNTFSYTFDERCSPGKHELVIITSDDNDNYSKLTINFVR